ncbi:MAG: nucleotidyltransferase domain-containing protein [Candidatus Methanospirare jalkutatii]|nr:nucleotidyltransferase domain-containing protein [Candidatus Methanospirare jalkutatii]
MKLKENLHTRSRGCLNMIERYFDELIKIAKERKEYFENYMHYARLVKEAVKGEVIVFGSVVEGKHTMASDIDLLVVLDSIERRDEILMKINEVLGEFHPFQIHLVTRKEFEWYKRFIKKWRRVE